MRRSRINLLLILAAVVVFGVGLAVGTSRGQFGGTDAAASQQLGGFCEILRIIGGHRAAIQDQGSRAIRAHNKICSLSNFIDDIDRDTSVVEALN